MNISNDGSGNFVVARQHRKGHLDGYFSMLHNIEREFEDKAKLFKERILVKDGVWQVGVEDRPNGWELLGVKER